MDSKTPFLKRYFLSRDDIVQEVNTQEEERKRIFLEACNNHVKISSYKTLRINQGAVQKANNYYWNNIVPSLKLHIADKDGKKTLDRFKVISGTELSIIHAQPIRASNLIAQRQANARLATYVAQSFFLNYILLTNHSIQKNSFAKEEDNVRIEESELIRKHKNFRKDYGSRMFMKKHRIWLEKCQPNSINNVTCNSHSWFVYYCFFCSSEKIVANYAPMHKLG